MSIEDFSNILKKKTYPTLCPDEKELIDLFHQVKHSKADVNKLLSDAWLGIYANNDSLFNPLNNLPPQAADNFTQYLVWLMSQPDYFYFIIKCLFNMDSFPFQCLLLREMFNHRYPLVIASRGAAKSSTLGLYILISMIIRPNIKIVITGAGFRQAKLVFQYMEDVWNKSPVLRSCFPGQINGAKHGTDSWQFRLGHSITYALPVGPDGSKVRGYRANILCVHRDTLIHTDIGVIKIGDFYTSGATLVLNENGKLEKPKRFFSTDPQDVYHLQTQSGKELKCSGHHKIRCVFNDLIQWRKVSELNNSNLVLLANGKYDHVKFVTKLDDQDVLYDFVMPETNSFIGNDFINHNCADEFSCTRKSFIQTDLGLKRIEDIVNNKLECNVINHLGEYEPIVDWIKTPKTDVYKLTTKHNYEIEFSQNHKFMLEDGSWKRGVDLKKGDMIRFDNNYIFPDVKHVGYKDISPNDIAYLGGLLISEGDLSNKHRVTITSTDKNLIDEICETYKSLNPSVYERPAYIDDRGWNCKKSYVLGIQGREFREFLYNLGYDYNCAINKKIPESIMCGSEEIVLNFLRGLFIGDGSVFIWKNDKRKSAKKRLGVAYYTSSKEMIDQLHILLKCLGFICSKNKRRSKISKNDQWMLRLNGARAHDFIKKIEYPNYQEYIDKSDDPLFQKTGCSYKRKKDGKFITSVWSNCHSEYLGVYNTIEESKAAISDFLKNEVLCLPVKNVKKLDELDNLYDISLPSTHSYYANGMVNHNSLNRTVFEEVMSGFLAVSADPIEQMSKRAQTSLIDKLPDYAVAHLKKDDEYDPYQLNNQLILSGTAYYKHNHFYEYYKKWRDIISSAGDPAKLAELMGGDHNTQNLNWKDYSIFRVPIELTTSGFMDMSQISRIKASTTKDVYAREYSAVFTDDSDGFYRRSLIDSCTISDKNIVMKNDEHIKFGAVLYGDPKKKYIYGVDPAYEGDNFAIVVLECEPDYRKIVHVWTTQASDHKQLLADKIITENDYYHYAARKIRNLMKRFPCAYIAIDTQGGGRAVIEALSDDSKLQPGELMVLPYIDPTQPPKDSDSMDGDHIIFEIKPTSDWNIEANHSLKKDMEMKDILFPDHDGISYSMAEFYDQTMGDYSGLYDTLEDCIYEIEELKNELTMIAVTETATGKQRFDTPEVKIGITKKGKLRKDRYSALLMANYVARNMDVLIPRRISGDMFGEGGFAKPSVFLTGNTSIGNSNIVNQFEKLYDDQLSARGKPPYQQNYY